MKEYLCEMGISLRRHDIMYPEKLINVLAELHLHDNIFLYESWFEIPEGELDVKGETMTTDKLFEFFKNTDLLIDGVVIKLRKDRKILWIKTSERVANFAHLKIFGVFSEQELNLYKNVLLNTFKDEYYCAYMSSYVHYDNDEFRYLYHHGINLIVSKLMYFGKYIFDFIPKDKLLSYRHAYKIEEINDSVYIQLVKDLYNTPKWIEKRKIKKFIKKMELKELENHLEEIMYWDKKVYTFFLPGYEDYSKEYVEQTLSYFEEQNKKPVNNYTIEIIDELSIVLKKYKKTHFYYVEESMNAMEVVGFFIYTPDGEEPDYHIYDVKAHFEVEISCVSPSVEKYAQRNHYSVERLEDKHYLLKKEDEKEISIINHYINDKYGIEYDLRLTIQKESFNMKEIKSMINEYERMVKYAKLKEK